MKNEYKLKRVHLVDGKINLLTDKTGRNNYSIWKSLEKEKSERKIIILNSIMLLFHPSIFIISIRTSLLRNSFLY